MSTTLKVTGGTPSPAARTAGAELEYRADTEWPCTDNGTQPIAMELRSATGSHVGMIREGQPRTFENCRAAAGTGFGPMSFFGSGEETRGFVRGAAVCSVTDQGSVAMALIDDLSNEDTPVAGGRLIVWTKS
ncbi:hypothetical protein [Streptomyces sp. NPDC002889]|uniref:hypothetical protein n=1 Tax=Streptomyces sp. NPDC002889 TaxID=3364669 RepID=UPI0036BB2929